MSELSELQEHRKILQAQIKLAEDVKFLQDNPQFISVILEGYCKDEMQRTLGLAVCEKLDQSTRELCNDLAKASAALNNYLNLTLQLGEVAKEDIVEIDSQITELERSGE